MCPKQGFKGVSSQDITELQMLRAVGNSFVCSPQSSRQATHRCQGVAVSTLLSLLAGKG